MSDEVNSGDQSPDQAQAAQPLPYAELIDQIVDRLDQFFSEHLRTLLSNTDEYLFDSANHASSIDQQNRLFEFMNELRGYRETLEARFFEEINVYLNPISEQPKLPKKKQKKQQGGQLSLVGNDEMDEMVAMTTITSKATTDFSEQIGHLTARMQQIALHNNTMFHPEALKPVQVCDAFRDALLDSGFANENKLVLYKQFDRAVIRNIKDLYDELNQMMIDAGILPDIELGGHIGHADGGYDHYEEDVVEDVGEELPGEDSPPPSPPPMGGYSGGPRIGPGRGAGGYRAPAGGSPTANGYAAGAPQGGAPAGGAPAGGSAPAGGAPAGAGYSGGPRIGPGRAGGSYADALAPAATAGPIPGEDGGDAASGGDAPQGSFGGMPLSQVQQSIRDFVGGVPTDSDASAGPGGGGGGGYYSHRDVVDALSNMQVSTDITSTKLEFNAGAIKKAVLSTIGEKEGGVVNKRVNQVSEKTIDFIKLIFDAIIDDKSITDAIKTLLLSLQIPVIKAAMLDAEFFVDDQHPARQLLDKIAEAGVGVSEHSDPVYKEIQAVVTKLLKDYKEDVEAFTEALESLIKITEDIYSKAREREEEAQRQVKHAHARNVVLQEIRKITLGKELPQGIRTLVLKVWPSLMFNHYLRAGKANDEWVELLMILAKIIDSVQPVTSRAELEELGLTHEDIVNATETKLLKRSKSKDLVSKVIADLRTTYEELMQARDLPEETPEGAPSEAANEAVGEAESEAGEAATEEFAAIDHEEMAAAESEPEAEEAAEDPELAAKRKIGMLPNDVQPGAWFIVYNGEDKPVRRLKLAVILIQDATLVFVDHLGNVVIEKDAEQFAGEMERGLSGMIMQHSVFDHALKSALGSIGSLP